MDTGKILLALYQNLYTRVIHVSSGSVLPSVKCTSLVVLSSLIFKCGQQLQEQNETDTNCIFAADKEN